MKTSVKIKVEFKVDIALCIVNLTIVAQVLF